MAAPSALRARFSPVFALAALLAGCVAPGESGPSESLGVAGPSNPLPPLVDDPFTPNPPNVCDPSISIDAGSQALLVNDPAAIAGFTLERVVKQLITLSQNGERTPLEVVQRLFDTENTTAGGVFADNPHCDSPDNSAFKSFAAADCPRAEGTLAKSEGLFVPGDPDYFAPVAVVNRFDLTPVTVETCGEYRIVFAKRSGLTDPNDRVFLIFEGVLEGNGDVMACRSVASLWQGIGKEKDPAKIALALEKLFFKGLAGGKPVVHPNHFGLFGGDNDGYGSPRGQVRLSQRMQDPWEMREFHVAPIPTDEPPNGGDPLILPIHFKPVTVKNSPVASLFDPAVTSDVAVQLRGSFVWEQVPTLAARDVGGIRTQFQGGFTSGESALEGSAAADYATKGAGATGSNAFLDAITSRLYETRSTRSCPPGDPLDAEAILARASTQSCAGCHAPEQFLGAERKIGCGLAWPKSLGGAHIDEKGQLSPALKDVFLPHRASVLTTFLQGCDEKAIHANLQLVPGNGIPK